LCACLICIGFSAHARDDILHPDVLALIGKKPITIESFKSEMTRRSAQITAPEQKEDLLEEPVRSVLIYAPDINTAYDKDPHVMGRLKRLVVNKYSSLSKVQSWRHRIDFSKSSLGALNDTWDENGEERNLEYDH